MSRRAAKVDTNQAVIIGALRMVPGLSVFDLSAMGRGCSDILVGFQERNWLFEIKRAGKRAHLTPAQQRFRTTWRGQYAVIESAEEALAQMGMHIQEWVAAMNSDALPQVAGRGTR